MGCIPDRKKEICFTRIHPYSKTKRVLYRTKSMNDNEYKNIDVDVINQVRLFDRDLARQLLAEYTKRSKESKHAYRRKLINDERKLHTEYGICAQSHCYQTSWGKYFNCRWHQVMKIGVGTKSFPYSISWERTVGQRPINKKICFRCEIPLVPQKAGFHSCPNCLFTRQLRKNER